MKRDTSLTYLDNISILYITVWIFCRNPVENEEDCSIRSVTAVLCYFISGLMRSALNSHILDEWKDFPLGLMSSVSTRHSGGGPLSRFSGAF